MGRLAASNLQSALGGAFVVDNRAGAAGMIGAHRVAHAKPDGYTILEHTSVLAIHAVFNKKLNFNIQKDLVPISLLGKGPCILMASTKTPFSNIAELIDYAKNNPGKLNYASSGVGSTGHLFGERFARSNNLDLTHIPYPDSGRSYLALFAGEVQLVFDSVTALEMIRTGKVNALAVTSEDRWSELLEVPTMREQGFPDMTAELWTQLLAPAGTSQEIIEAIAATLADAAKSPEYMTIAKRAGMLAIGSSPAEARKVLDDDIAMWQTLADNGFELPG
ncbi:tripartite tricarboxylate transporter substrate binding protein [Advenella sp. S44]|uniref:Bug family tripartite tricarboxylate transporter substrate binding protein n=1 Tax=Advenella sp. S44 TaxID=1982755 RepID=UPI00137478FE|nr:tripartite tricarboxylate transporter substrate-binding protein [Advenella sp. S44]